MQSAKGVNLLHDQNRILKLNEITYNKEHITGPHSNFLCANEPVPKWPSVLSDDVLMHADTCSRHTCCFDTQRAPPPSGVHPQTHTCMPALAYCTVHD